jgi:hypothetical protein
MTNLVQQFFPLPFPFFDTSPLSIVEEPSPNHYLNFSKPEDLALKLEPPSDSHSAVYFVCNEDGQEQILESLRSENDTENGAHLGFSSWFNYDLIAARGSKIAFVCDINDNMFLYFKVIKEATLAAQNPKEFVAIFSNLVKKSGLIAEMDTSTFYLPITGFPSLKVFLENELVRKNSWLSTEKGFQRVKSLYQKNQFFHLPLNACDKTGNFEILSKWVISRGYQLDSLYLSNIYEWIENSAGEADQFIRNIVTIINNHTQVIDAIDIEKPLTSGIASGARKINLRISLGTIPLYDKKRKNQFAVSPYIPKATIPTFERIVSEETLIRLHHDREKRKLPLSSDDGKELSFSPKSKIPTPERNVPEETPIYLPHDEVEEKEPTSADEQNILFSPQFIETSKKVQEKNPLSTTLQQKKRKEPTPSIAKSEWDSSSDDE